MLKKACEKKYEELVKPASYEHVIDNLRLAKEDFLLYFKTATNQSQQQLREFLHSQLSKRSDEWIYNRPNRDLFDKLVEDFLNAYEVYFITTDPQLAILNVLNNSREILEIIYEIRSAIYVETGLSSRINYLESNQISEDITSFLMITNIPFETIEQSKRHIDVIITDPSSIFATRFYLSAINRIDNLGTIDNLLDRARNHGRFSHILLVVADPISFDIANYAEHRGITINSFREFRDTFLKISPTEKYVIGSLASQALLETYNIQEVYIEPDAVLVTPSDYVENKVLDIREPAIQLIEKFLEDQEQKILFLFGSYGSGKSALCSYLINKYIRYGKFTPIYISLRQLLSADDLVRVVTKADQLAKTINISRRKTLVFLDGLDELPNSMIADEKRHNMLRLLQAATK